MSLPSEPNSCSREASGEKTNCILETTELVALVVKIFTLVWCFGNSKATVFREQNPEISKNQMFQTSDL